MRAGTGWRRPGLLAGTVICLASAGVAAPLPAMDPGAAMVRIAAAPYRYGGELQGTVPGIRMAVDQPPVHLSIGLQAPSPDGRLQGEAILFTADRHLVALGLVTGRLTGGPTAGTGDCMLHLALPTQDVTLSGVCTADTLSGEVVSQPHHLDPLTRLASWWDDRAVAGRYWLTPASFDPGS